MEKAGLALMILGAIILGTTGIGMACIVLVQFIRVALETLDPMQIGLAVIAISFCMVCFGAILSLLNQGKKEGVLNATIQSK